jgi:hypothetical protein
MQKFQFVRIDSVLGKFERDFRGLDITENDAIEWVGEALGFMKIPSASQEAIAFIEVKNYQADIPNGLHYVTQIARNREWNCFDDTIDCVTETMGSLSTGVPDKPINFEDCQGSLLCKDAEPVYYRPLLDLQYEYVGWANSYTRKTKYSPVRLANHSFFNTLVCKEPGMEDLYCNDCPESDQYDIVQDQFRFNFKEGLIALAYIRQMIDSETGYYMVPDDEYARAAITYYIAWKTKQREAYNHREGAMAIATEAKNEWNSYIKKFKNKAKMPSGVDQYQNLMEQSKYILPNDRRYYGFFGKLGTAENRIYNGNNYRQRNARY